MVREKNPLSVFKKTSSTRFSLVKNVLSMVVCLFLSITSGYAINSPDADTETVSLESTEGDNTVQITLKGVILDEMGAPLPGASVFEKGTSNGVNTDFEGSFTLSVSSSDAVIVVSYLGFDKVEILAANFDDNTNITLVESSSALDEIVVTGYGRQVKRNIT